MQAVSCEIRVGSEKELREGIYPSAMAQRLRPMACIPNLTTLLESRCRQQNSTDGGTHEPPKPSLVPQRKLFAPTVSRA
jgi:hypothetical protein